MLLRLQLVDPVLKRSDVTKGVLDRCLVTFGLPASAVVIVNMLASTPLFRLDVNTELALFLERQSMVNHFHTASLARAILGLTVLSEVAPLPAAALVDILFVETHVSEQWLMTSKSRDADQVIGDSMLGWQSSATAAKSVGSRVVEKENRI